MGFVGMLPFLTAALLYYYDVLYRAQLVPRWLSGWGLIGAALGLVAAVYAGYTQDFGVSTVSTVTPADHRRSGLVLADRFSSACEDRAGRNDPGQPPRPAAEQAAFEPLIT
jgi:Domain of unknown function (DUF4386)